VSLLETLGLASVDQVNGVAGRVQRLSRGLPAFESIWVDALVQGGRLTPYQAARINAGHGERLRVGPYLIERPIDDLDYAVAYLARESSTGYKVNLTLITATSEQCAAWSPALDALVSKSLGAHSVTVVGPHAWGTHDGGLWIATSMFDGRQAARSLVFNGRFPAEAVLETARQMVNGLAAWEAAGLVHGDLRIGRFWIDRVGSVQLAGGGIRGIVRPTEGFSSADLPPEAYDNLAPERVAEGHPPSVASDLYAAGCLWWQLLTGRTVLAGGDALRKLCAAEAANIPDVRRIAPDVPTPLAAAIERCTTRDPGERPADWSELVDALGPSTRQGRAKLAGWLRRPNAIRRAAVERPVSMTTSSHGLVWSVSAAAVMLAGVCIWWQRDEGPTKVSPYVMASVVNRLGTAGERVSAAGRIAGTSGQRPSNAFDGIPVEIPGELLEGERRGATRIAPRNSLDIDNGEVPYGEVSHDGARVQNAPKSNAVELATYESPIALPGHTSNTAVTAPSHIDPTDQQNMSADRLPAVRAGQTIAAANGGRLSINVSGEGLTVSVSDVTFQDVDFHWSPVPGTAASGARSAMVRLAADRARFVGCTFSGGASSSVRPSAIVWSGAPRLESDSLALPNGSLELADCVVRDVAAAVRSDFAAAVKIDVANTLHLGPGPLLRLDRLPQADEPVWLGLSHSTLREAACLVECRYDSVDRRAGRMMIAATANVFALVPGGGLLVWTGPESADPLLAAIEWDGEGSVLGPDSPLAVWRRLDGSLSPIDSARLDVAGLVRSDVGFAGPADDSPSASHAVRWQVPLVSTDPPGIRDAALLWPRREASDAP